MASRAPTVDGDAEYDLFTKDGVPVKFCFHSSVTQGRGQITRDVERHGGKIVADERDTNVLLVDEQQDLALIRRRYYSSTWLYRLSVYVEPRGFVKNCIRVGDYHHVRPMKQRMPGPPRGHGRVAFTAEDRDYLAYYIATRCPTKDGRLGMNAYKDLERLGQTEDESWAWARRHTRHSWREHYKKNPGVMDRIIDYYLQRLKLVGHHLGHDPRTREYQNLRQEMEQEEEEDENEEEEEEEEQQGRGRQEVAGRQPAQDARDYLARHEGDLITFGEEEGQGLQEDMPAQGPQRTKRHRLNPDAHRQRDVEESLAKRVRVAEASSRHEERASGVEIGHDTSNQASPGDINDTEELQEVEGSDLFGDREYESDLGFDFDHAQDVEFPTPYSPKSYPVPEQRGPPATTQATLVASPRLAEKEAAPAPAPVVPPSSQMTLVMTQERVGVQRARGASAQSGPSIRREASARGGALVGDAPFLNTRARSRSVEPQPQIIQGREDKGGKGKRKGMAREQELVPIPEVVHVEEGEEYPQAVVPASSTRGLSMRETFEDEMAVVGLLEGSALENEEDEEDEGDVPALPPFQEIEVVESDSEPSDSDDAETHRSLVFSVAREGSAGGSEGEESEESEDADRVARMANVSLQGGPAAPRQTRSGIDTREAQFPSPGTKARAVVERVREEERRLPYAPPPGSRAAKAVKARMA